MMPPDAPHSCEFWAVPGGGMVCACGKSRRPILTLVETENETKDGK